MSFETVVDRLSGQSRTTVLGLYGLLERGAINAAEFTETAVQVLQVANARGAAAGEAVFRAYLEQATGRPYSLPGVPPPADAERLQKALGTILAAEQDTIMQLERLTSSEPLDAASRAYQDAMSSEATVTGWERGLDSDACQLCTWWWREGQIFHPSHRMPRHTGCKCHPIPRINVRTSNYQTERNARRAAA